MRWRTIKCVWVMTAWWLTAAVSLAVVEPKANPSSAKSKGAIDFNRDIRPIFSENCYACHGPDKNKRKAGLRLDREEDAFAKLESGDFAIVHGDVAKSKLLKVIASETDDERMPPPKTGKRLTKVQIDLLREWVAQGAKWKGHWSYLPAERPSLPPIKNKNWAKNEIDQFILTQLEKKGMKPAPEADKTTLIRRASLDLIGLPPTIEEVDSFLSDKDPKAYEKLVDRLLDSPHYGERLALMWLDLARYADTSGYHFDGYRQMHPWRDWVIKSFNQNKPFDQFTIEQIAGDLLPNATLEQKIATGFHRNVMTNDEGGADPDEYLTKYVVDRVSTTAQVWLGTTLGCAECHDHKYDPISTKEFYQFYAFYHNVPEKGLDGTRERNPAPVLKLPTLEQGSRLAHYLERIPAAEKTLSEREADLPKAQEKWEKEVQAQPLNEPELEGLLLEFAFDESINPRSSRGNEAPKSEIRNQKSEIAQGLLPSAATNLVWAAGKIGRALQFRGGTNEFVDAGQAVRFENTNAFSYGAWIKLHGKSGAVLSKMEEAPSHRGFDLLINEGKAEAHLVNKFPDNALKVVTKEPLPTNVWQHVFLTYDGSNKAAGVKLYVDGKSRSLDAPNDKLSATIMNDLPLLIGTRNQALPFNGLIDDVRFYSRALKPEEIVTLAAYGQLQAAIVPADQRIEEQKADLKKFFRENRATDFIQAQERVSKLRKEKDELLAKIPDTMVMDELEKPRDTFVLVRGNFQKKGEKVTAGLPACWPPLPADQPANRLALAGWLVATNNPLTARVTVNRYWSLCFGTGLVKTSNDFGSQGDQPSHPELLDWLACEFMAPAAKSEIRNPKSERSPNSQSSQKGPASSVLNSEFKSYSDFGFRSSDLQPWDTKHLLRLLVTSATYRQSAVVSKEKLERDPYNRMLSRGPRLRFDAELIRDNALAVSGLLNPKIGGPSVKPYQPPGIWDVTDHKYEQHHGEDLYRRGMYVFWKRAAHYPSFATFDAPNREVCAVQRPRTSTPLQSLVLMNDPVYVEAARALAARTLREGGSDLSQQLAYAFRLTLARPPQKKELEILTRTYHQHKDNFTQDKKAAEDLLSVGESPRPKELDAVELAAMTGVANVLLNLNETITK